MPRNRHDRTASGVGGADDSRPRRSRVRTRDFHARTTFTDWIAADGAPPLEFHLHLGTRLSAGFTFDGICANDLLKLMQRWGFAATELEERADQVPLIKSTVQDQPFLVAFVGEREDGNGYGMIGLRTFMRFEDGVPEGLLNAINTSFATVKASVDKDGDLVVQTPIILHGGVTADNLEMCFKIWRETLEEIALRLE